MARPRELVRIGLTTLLTFSLIATPLWSAPAAAAGTVVSADRAIVGTAAASVGTTVFDGDTLATATSGSMQVRAGAARLQLSASSRVTWATEAGMPAAALTSGTATFSTANSKAFALHMATAVIRPRDDGPTIGNVTVLGPKELVVRCTRGALTISVEDDTRAIPEGVAYHVVLDPDPRRAAEANAAAQPGPQKYPKKPGRSKFIWYAIGAAGVATYFFVSEALESPDRP